MFETIIDSLSNVFTFVLELLNKIFSFVETVETDDTTAEPLDTEQVKRRRYID